MVTFSKDSNGYYQIQIPYIKKNGKKDVFSKTFKPTPNLTPDEEEKELERYAFLLFIQLEENRRPGRMEFFRMRLKKFINAHFLNRRKKKNSAENHSAGINFPVCSKNTTKGGERFE
jgi:hypothetical protein